MGAYRKGQVIAGTQYRFIKMLGAGGHGTVYAVEHTFLEAPAVMKLLHSELANESNLAQRMTREARTLAKLRHPNIVEVRDGGITTEDPPRPFFVMESLNGMSLRELVRHMKGRGIGVLPALRIMSAVFEGLHHAHSAGVIHRDIKPDNIFLHRSSTDLTVPKILDFGIAHLLMGKRFTGNSFVGTPRYAAPEQLMGETPTVTTDVYSAGLVLYELMTGRSPYHDKRDIGPLLHAHLNEKLPPVSARAADATREVDDFIDYLLEKDPSRRPPTAFAAAVAVRELRAFIEQRQSTSLESDGFRTEPTPLDNFLVEKSPGGIAFLTEEGRSTPPPATPRNATLQSAAVAPVVMQQLTEPLRGPSLSVDRAAPTRTSLGQPAARTPDNDTMPISLREPEKAADPGDPPIVYNPELLAAIDSTTATDFVEATGGDSEVVPVPTFGSRLNARPVLVFAVALIFFCGIGVPVAVTIAKRYALPPPRATASANQALKVPSSTVSVPPSAAIDVLPAVSSAPSATPPPPPPASAPLPEQPRPRPAPHPRQPRLPQRIDIRKSDPGNPNNVVF